MADYNPSGNPATDSDGSSEDIRNEFGLIQVAIASKQNYDAQLGTWSGITPGTGVATALAVNVGTAGAPVVNGGALGTPSGGTLTNCTGYPIAAQIDGSAAAAIADADSIGFVDASASNVLAKITWANVKAAFVAAANTFTAAQTITVDSHVPLALNSTRAAVNARTRLNTDKADSSVSYVLSNSHASVDEQISVVLRNSGGVDIYVGQTAGAEPTSGIQAFGITGGATMKVQQALEKITITAAAPGATQHFNFLTQAIQYFTTAGANNWTLNVRGDSGTSLDSLMAVGECATITVQATMTGTPYYASAMTIDGNAVTPKWVGGTAPTSGDASCINIYTYSITKTAAATFTVIASKAKTS